MDVIQKLKNLAVKYGFKVMHKGEKYYLCAKNTDHKWSNWIVYLPKESAVGFLGNTDHLNLWFCETRKDLTPDKCLQFVAELNEALDLSGENKFLVRELIDPEDWQAIASVPDAYADSRYFCKEAV